MLCGVALFGKLEIQLDGHDLIGCEARKLQELLCYLLLYRDRPHNRETLAAVFWADSTTAQSKKYLRQTLWQLQTALGGHGMCHHASSWPGATGVRLNTQAGYWLDVRSLKRRLRACAYPWPCPHGRTGAVLAGGGSTLPGGCSKAGIRRLVHLRARAFAEHVPGDARQVNRLQCANGDLTAVCSTAPGFYAMIGPEKARHRRLMRLYYLTGDRTGALRQYQACVKAFERRLDIEPATTRKLYEHICADDFPP